MSDVFDCSPNAGKFIETMRSSGYDSYDSMCDIIDNCIDATATIVKFGYIRENNEEVIFVADNGYGMDCETLKESIKFGSNTEKDPASSLGKFGVGMTTASISIARKLEVISKEEDGELFVCESDVDHIIATNKWESTIRPADERHTNLLQNMLAENAEP